MIPYGPWHPDKGAYSPGICLEARNCVRVGTGYRPLSSPADFNAGALASRPTFLSMFRARDHTAYVLSGDAADLYRLNAGTMAWDVISQAGGYLTGDERWQVVQWGDEVVLTNYADAMQVYDLLAGTPAADLDSNAPQARFLTVCGPYVVAGDTIDIVDGAMPNRIRWCGIEDIRSWIPAVETTADWQDQPNVGHLNGLTGGRQLVCLFEEGIVVGTIIGAPKAFRFDQVEGSQGCMEARSVIQHRGATYYLSRSGFQMFDGRQSVPIGAMKANRWFFKDAIFGSLNRMSVGVDRQQKVIVWLYCGSGGDGITPNRALLLNYDEMEFTVGEITAQLVGAFSTPGYNIDTVDGLAPGGSVDQMPAPFDDPFYVGGVPLFGCFIDDKLHTLTGNPLTALIGTSYINFDPIRRALLTEVWDVMEGAVGGACQIWTMDTKASTPREWPTVNRNSFGFYPVRAEGRFHQIRRTIPGAWTGAYGVDVTPRLLGYR